MEQQQGPLSDKLKVFGLERFSLALVPAGVGAALLYTVLDGLGASSRVAAFASVAFAPSAALWLSTRLPSSFDGSLRRNTLRSVLWFAVGLGAIGATARLATFMADETKGQNAMYAFDSFFVHHSCLTAYFQGARFHREGVPNVYERTLYEGPTGEPKFIGSFVTDVYLYPPPFLLLARLALAISEDFAAWRAVWFGIEGAVVMGALVGLALWIGGPVGRRVALLSPLVWLSFPTLITLQFGNFQLVAIGGSVLAMVAFECRRNALGGALLAALALSKVFPGILVILLLFQRRWRAVAWTAGFGAFFLVGSYAVLGEAPFRALLSYHLPRMSSGAALETLFARPDNIAASHSVYGLVQKLGLLGLPGASQSAAIAATWVYTLLLIGVVAAAARLQPEARTSEGKARAALVWLAVVQLASLRAPFTPDTYALFAPVWTLVLLLALVGADWRGWRPVALVTLIVLANLMVPAVEIMPLPLLLTLTLAHQIVFLALFLGMIAVLWRRTNAGRAVHL